MHTAELTIPPAPTPRTLPAIRRKNNEKNNDESCKTFEIVFNSPHMPEFPAVFLDPRSCMEKSLVIRDMLIKYYKQRKLM